MYYKVLLNNEIVDLLSSLQYVRYQNKHHRAVAANAQNGEAIISSDGKQYWYLDRIATNTELYTKVDAIEKISESEYKRLTIFNGQTPEEIIDNYTMYLIEEGLL